MKETILTEKLRGLRKLAGYSQENLAYELSMSRQGYGYFETGHRIPSSDILRDIAALYQLPPQALIDDTIPYELVVTSWNRRTLLQKKTDHKTIAEETARYPVRTSDGRTRILVAKKSDFAFIKLYRRLDQKSKCELTLFLHALRQSRKS